MTKASFNVVGAEFLFGAPTLEAIPRQNLPEVAIVGRSNVGKSTFINKILKRKNLARASSTPGCTTELNFFKTRLAVSGKERQFVVVDLPGFGFAKLPKAQREGIERTIVEYLRTRGQLKVIVLLNDVRRTPQPDELAVRRVAADEGIDNVIVLTKTDTLNVKELQKAVKAATSAYNLDPDDVVLSSRDMEPEVFWRRIVPLLD